jgi:benzoyl-CoA 2,3-dioxygenase component B
MLTEEAHHMFVGETGVGRVIKRTLEVMKEMDTDDVATLRQAGVIDLPTIQRFMNFWFTSSLDLFGSESSSNAANYFSNGIKGRPDEAKFADHVEADTEMTIQVPDGKGGLKNETVSVRNGMNEVTRLEYVKDCNVGVTRWNMGIKRAGVNFELKLPSTRFRRQVGAWSGVPTTPEGQPISQAEFDARKDEWLPTEADIAFVKSLMHRVTEPGKMAAWIAPPDRGINANPIEYEYVKL